MAARVPAAAVEPHVAGMLFRAALAAAPLPEDSTHAVAAGEHLLPAPLWDAGRAESLRTPTRTSALHHEVRASVCDRCARWVSDAVRKERGGWVTCVATLRSHHPMLTAMKRLTYTVAGSVDAVSKGMSVLPSIPYVELRRRSPPCREFSKSRLCTAVLSQVTHALQAMLADRGDVRGIATEAHVCDGLLRVDLLVTTVDGREVRPPPAYSTELIRRILGGDAAGIRTSPNIPLLTGGPLPLGKLPTVMDLSWTSLIHTLVLTQVAVEVDGPLHFSANLPYMPLGHTLLRNRLLRARGVQLVCVPYYRWNALQGAVARQQYLAGLLAGRGDVEY
jgi:hypothetical protein